MLEGSWTTSSSPRLSAGYALSLTDRPGAGKRKAVPSGSRAGNVKKAPAVRKDGRRFDFIPEKVYFARFNNRNLWVYRLACAL